MGGEGGRGGGGGRTRGGGRGSRERRQSGGRGLWVARLRPREGEGYG